LSQLPLRCGSVRTLRGVGRRGGCPASRRARRGDWLSSNLAFSSVSASPNSGSASRNRRAEGTPGRDCAWCPARVRKCPCMVNSVVCGQQARLVEITPQPGSDSLLPGTTFHGDVVRHLRRRVGEVNGMVAVHDRLDLFLEKCPNPARAQAFGDGRQGEVIQGTAMSMSRLRCRPPERGQADVGDPVAFMACLA